MQTSSIGRAGVCSRLRRPSCAPAARCRRRGLPADAAGGQGHSTSAWPGRAEARWTCSIRRPDVARPALDGRLVAALERAAAAGLVEITEMGMRSWAYLDALAALAGRRSAAVPGPDLRGERPGRRDAAWLSSTLAARDCGPVAAAGGDQVLRRRLARCPAPARCAATSPTRPTAALLFTDAPTLARRIEPLAGRGWRIATHAIGDRGRCRPCSMLMTWPSTATAAAMAAAAPRIEHASVLSAELIARMADSGVVCLHPAVVRGDRRRRARPGPRARAGRAAPTRGRSWRRQASPCSPAPTTRSRCSIRCLAWRAW